MHPRNHLVPVLNATGTNAHGRMTSFLVVPGYSCREFHKLSKDTRSSKSEFGIESNDQNTKHHKADFCE